MLSTNMEVWQIQVLIKLEVKATLKLFFNLEDKKKQELTMFYVYRA